LPSRLDKKVVRSVCESISEEYREFIFREIIGFLKKGCWSMKLFIHHLGGAKTFHIQVCS
jgi:hypothetical protein